MYHSEEGEGCLVVISIDINADQGDVYGEVQMMEVKDSEDFSKFSFFTKGDNVYGVQAVVAAKDIFDALLSSIQFEE